ncbi:MAG: fimbrillin family protein [Tannerellaceae bacterium]|jgi:hypothetical protein|nr:fimbrillin family protein [Tannerellaceae bacterium]
MKKLFFPAVVIAAITLASCAKQDVLDEHSSRFVKPILFDAFVGKSMGVNTKASILKLDGQNSLQVNGFIVQAYNTDNLSWNSFTPTVVATFMKDQVVTCDIVPSPPIWEYIPIKYWPADNGKVTFFAYGASGASSSVPNGLSAFTGGTSQGVAPKFDFTVNNAVASQVDLVADALFDRASNINGGKVNLVFDHILAKVAFSAKMAQNYTGATVIVKDMQLGFSATAIQTNGKFAFDGTGTTLGAWTLGITPKTYIPTDYQDLYTGSGVTLGTAAKEINDADKYLMVLPEQTIATNALTVKLQYTIQTGAETVTYNVVKPLPAVTLAMGKQYTFNFTFTLTEVGFAGITVSAWSDGTTPNDTGI